ncbi:hypothetical protein CDAR_587531 [Caerostris darwini]|uniref:Uncharacterized protein n=1 Tax=Caerostris darwini TaxID=1538125 RepID=A0AAV4SJW8_9ARAC|nr:hypothetical protein CDAR_587531 [Caerostris darwini]
MTVTYCSKRLTSKRWCHICCDMSSKPGRTCSNEIRYFRALLRNGKRYGPTKRLPTKPAHTFTAKRCCTAHHEGYLQPTNSFSPYLMWTHQ